MVVIKGTSEVPGTSKLSHKYRSKTQKENRSPSTDKVAAHSTYVLSTQIPSYIYTLHS
jgi:hypothetical protein